MEMVVKASRRSLGLIEMPAITAGRKDIYVATVQSLLVLGREEMVVVAKVVETARVKVVVVDMEVRTRTVVSSFSRGSLDSFSY